MAIGDQTSEQSQSAPVASRSVFPDSLAALGTPYRCLHNRPSLPHESCLSFAAVCYGERSNGKDLDALVQHLARTLLPTFMLAVCFLPMHSPDGQPRSDRTPAERCSAVRRWLSTVRPREKGAPRRPMPGELLGPIPDAW